MLFATTFRASGMSITDAQLSTAANVTAGYPYMIQLVGYHIWDAADMRDSDTIIDADVTAGIEEARIDLDNACASRSCKAYPKTTVSISKPWQRQMVPLPP